ncbi:LamG-like jellyroll fold domain-containing protein [Streptomyces sp. Li-HN-5-11]|uniref:LamG-like jellyroll fold domain-containing protein n=1 Tax=Streptomyces sp. Li-HN-5-11 TaxID=3075432 RepID=UPI0028A6E6AB|nr:LamG-like jellyroll fold domain-containing protein [Streptomyces sp. Li-HN-5-11]WNM29650.1 LamG-like jellyroll fold domain-containing protein [Streptomyces sp. Li-HN-5-11]
MQAAGAQARATGKPVVVSSLTTPTTQVRALPDGRFGMAANPLPVRTKQSGRWVPVDLTLARRADGGWAPKATAYGSVSFSGGGTGPLAVTHSGGVSLSLSWPAALPAPHVTGATATYASVLPGVDLRVSATPAGGLSDTLVVRSAAAAKNPGLAALRLATTVHGGHLAPASDGGLTITDAHGNAVADAPTALQWDSNRTLRAGRHQPAGAKVAADASDAAHPGLAARTAPVRAKVAAGSLTLVPDRSMFTAKSTVWPVYVDPSVNWHPTDYQKPAFDEVKQGCPGNSFYNQTGSLADNGYLGVGYNGWPEGACNTGDEHAIYQWSLSKTIWGADIHSAQVDATEIYSASCSTTATVNLHWSKGIGSGTDWSNRPGYNSYSTSASYGPAYNPTYCSGNGSVTNGFNVLTPIRSAASGHSSSFTATLSEDSMESSHNDLGFKRFDHNPTLQIFYNNVPSNPNASTMAAVSGADRAGCDTTAPYPYMGKTIASTPPVLKAKVSDPNGDKLQATFQYWVDGSTTKYTLTSGDNLASGTYATVSLPASFVSSLTNGKTVDWDVKVTDGMDTTSYSKSPTCHFTAEPTAPDTPAVTSENNLYPNTDDVDSAVGAAAGTTGAFDIDGSGTTATKFVYNLDVPPAKSSPPASETVTASGNKATVKVTPPSPGPHTLYVYAVDGAGDDSGDFAYPFIAAGHAGTTCASLAACYNNVGISSDSNKSQADLDGTGHSFSATDLAGAGWSSGGKITVDGTTLTLPSFGSGQKDNVLAGNQTVTYSGSGSALVFLATSTSAAMSDPGAIDGDDTAPYVPSGTAVSGSYCFSGTDPADACAASGTINYTDGTSTSYDLTVPDWAIAASPISTVVLPHYNSSSSQTAGTRSLFAFSVPITASKTIASVTLPDVSTAVASHEQGLHIFSMGTRNTTAGTAEANGSYAAASSGKSWTGAWANATEGNYNLLGSNFSNQTFRIALKPSVSGGTVRVKLDNALGSSPLSIGHATIALSSTPAAIGAVPATTPTTLKFGGSQSVTIPEGGMAYSDPLSFTVTAGQYLLVSYQLSNSVPYLVQHSYANGSYEYVTSVGSGDLTTSTSATAFTTNAAAYGNFTDLVTGLDVQSANVPTEAVLGDNLVDPFQPNTTLPNSNGSRVSDALTAAEPSTPSPYGVLAEGIESNQLMTDDPETYNGKTIGGPAALSRLDRDILDQPGVTTVIVDEGLEDLLAGATSDSLDADGYTALVQQLQGWGINVVLTSQTPCEGFAGDGATPNDPCTSTVDANRTDVNAFLGGMNLGNPWATPAVYFADFDAAVAVTDSTTGEEKLSAAADGGDHANLSLAAFGALSTALLSPEDTWNFDDGNGMPVATDTAATDTLNTLNAAGTDTNLGNNPLTLTGSATWAADTTRGTVLSLNGTTDYAASANTGVLDTSASYSISTWVKLSTTPSKSATAFSVDGTTDSPFYLKYIANSGSPKWAFQFPATDTTSPSFKGPTGGTPSSGSWTHLVGVYNAATQTAQLYVNGVLVSSATGISAWKAGGALNAGAALYNGSMTDYFPGEISGAQLYDYALTANQVTALYDQIP